MGLIGNELTGESMGHLTDLALSCPALRFVLVANNPIGFERLRDFSVLLKVPFDVRIFVKILAQLGESCTIDVRSLSLVEESLNRGL